MGEAPLFRANKRRKFIRQKEAEHGSDLESPKQHPEQTGQSCDEDDEDESQVKVSDLLKMRRHMKPRGTGIQFSQHKTNDTDGDLPDSMALTKVDPPQERLQDMSSRFIGSTGQVVDIDKHMMAYIDSKMAEHQNSNPQASSSSTLYTAQTTTSSHTNPPPPPPPSKPTPEYPSRSQLAEFDLGPDAHAKNLALTTAAIARAQSGLPLLPPPAEDPKSHRPRKPRLGRDGKPLRPRPRKRRNSEDVARDAIVEQMLHEHRVDGYEGGNGGGDGDGDGGQADENDEYGNADERLAEQFKQEFMEAMAERQKKNHVKATTAAKAKGMGPEQFGPKLGGSRSARAKMAQMQQQEKQQQQSQGQGLGQGQHGKGTSGQKSRQHVLRMNGVG